MTQRAFTIIELLVAIALVAVLVSLILPVISNSRATGKTVNCMSNLRQLNVAWNTVLIENKNKIPVTYNGAAKERWDIRLLEVMDISTQVRKQVVCPTAIDHYGDPDTAGWMTYGINVRWEAGGAAGENAGKHWGRVVSASEYPLIHDTAAYVRSKQLYDEVGIKPANDGVTPLDEWRIGFFHPKDTANTSWADGSVTAIDRTNLQGAADENGVPRHFLNEWKGAGTVAMR